MGRGGGAVSTAVRSPAQTTGNLLLDALPADDRAMLDAHLEPFALASGLGLYEPDADITHVYFPCDGVISMVCATEAGVVEVGTIGREGMTGIPVLLHARSMPTRTFVQVPGDSWRVPVSAFRDAVKQSGAIERLMLRYVLAFIDQLAQSVACNRLHTLEERCARWILMTHDRVVGDELLLKHTFLAEMLGVHRPAVTVAAGALQRAGLISYRRGRIQVVNRAGLEAASCECYAVQQRAIERLWRLGSAPLRE